MNPKASATLEKAREDRRRSHFDKALSRLEEAIGKFPKELMLYTEAIDVGMEAGEPLKTIQILRKAQRELPDDPFELWTSTVEKVGVYNDAIVGRFMLEQATKNGDMTAAYAILQSLSDHAAGEVLEHVRTKKQTMSLAMGTGHAERDAVVSYTLGEALVELRLGRLAEAVEGFVRALDESPGLFKPLEPFLSDLEKQHADKGEASYALGCCHVAGGRIPQGVENLARAARRAPSIAARVIEKIESLGGDADLSPDLRDAVLAELRLSQGDTRRAAEILSAMLDRNAATAGRIADILKPAVEEVGENLDLHFVFVEAAATAERRDGALSHLRKIYDRREHRAPLVAWLESKSASGKFAAEVQLFFAETALSEGLYGKAIEIFKAMLSRGSGEHAPIKELLSRHRSHPVIQRFYAERFGASPARERETTFEFERYDDGRFAHSKVEPMPDKDTGEASPPQRDAPGATAGQLEIDAPSPGTAAAAYRGDAEDSGSLFDNRDFSLSIHAPEETPAGDEAVREDEAAREGASPPAPSEEEEAAAAATPPAGGIEDSDLFEYLKRDFSAAAPPSPEVAEPTDEPGGPAGEEAPVDDWSGQDALAEPDREEENGPAEGAPSAAAEVPADFDSLYRSFLEGTLDRGRFVEVIERAYDEDRMDEMKRLLAFEPANLGEEIARKYQLARYYLATERPMPALVALKTVQLAALSREERKTFLLRIAESYRQLHNFEAAHGVYLRILGEHPGDPAAEAAAKTNYTMYVEAAAGAAPMIEKLTDL